MTRLHLTAGRAAAVAAQLSARDLDVVATLAALRLATTDQLQRVWFADGSPLTQARRCRATLERLVRLGVVTRLDRRIGGVRRGSASYVNALGVAGQRLHGGVGPAGRGVARRPWTPSLPFVAHVLAVTELYVQLVEAERQRTVDLIAYTAEPAAWRRFTGPTGASVTLKPDAYAVIGKGDVEEHRFIEVDRGTESLGTIAAKLRTYRQYWQSGREQHQRGVFPQVLFVVPDERRLQGVVDTCARQPADSWSLFQVVVWSDAVRIMTEARHD
jgi:hypothetical protein